MRWLLVFLLLPLSLALPQTSFPITNEDVNSRKVYDVIVVGAGLTGLAAARRILEKAPNATVLLLEGRGQVGGRVRARSMATAVGDDWVDMGSQFVSRDHLALLQLAKEMGVEMKPQTNCGQRSVLVEGVRRRKRREISFSSTLSVRPSFDDVIASRDMPALSQESVGQFVQRTRQLEPDAAAINRLLQTLYDAPENSVSALQVALTAGSENSTVAELLLNNGHGNSLLAEGGMYKLAIALADGLDINYNEKVIGINQESSPVMVMTSSSSYSARQVVVAVPPPLASAIVYSPPLATPLKSFLERYRPTGSAFYFTMTYPTAFWRGEGKNGQLIYTSDKGAIAWLTTFDMTTSSHCVSSMGTTGVLWGLAHFMDERVGENERHRQYIDVISKTMPTQIQPLDVKDVQFSSDPFSLGSISVLPPSIDTSSLQYINGINKHGNCVVLASAEFSRQSLGLMNGAVLSGQMAADDVIQRISGVQSNSILSESVVRMLDVPSETGLSPSSSPPSAFVYHTSTHYPPTTTISPLSIRIVLAPASSNNSMFPYSTSTHYPPTEESEPTFIEDNQIPQRDSPLDSASSSSFNYQTSSHYPPTQKVETTTYKHFSMGNLDQNDTTAADQKLALDSPIQSNSYTDNQVAPEKNTATTFDYRTSSHYPPTEKSVETTTYKHFSMGNLEPNEEEKEMNDDDAPLANMILGPAWAGDPATNDTAKTFDYRTSSHYPPTEKSVETTTYKHFSMGNADNSETKQDLTLLHVAQDSPNAAGQSQSPAPSVLSANQVMPTVDGVNDVRVGGPVSPQLVQELRGVAENAASQSQLSLATQLTSIVQRLLETLQRLRL